ncbi:YtxH domain-containing protein [Paenibacillus sp. GCM10012307]|uniref:YtxH domain-containing protein n=1 Tax=Paenibacillus roseus TaxID=2798579 RepID=A0A934J3V2_9BACL|nr:YtxH domain-containing protein [Paenibacillus roseus]MBJ6359812.1 YtxH domain-containing protein [Paenibacillus roseus]
MTSGKKTKGYLLAALAGSIAGAIGALLLAPKSGKELRRDIADGATQVSEKTVQLAGQVKDETVRLAQQIGRQTTHLAGKTKDSATHAIHNLKSWKDQRGAQGEAGTVEVSAVQTIESDREEPVLDDEARS